MLRRQAKERRKKEKLPPLGIEPRIFPFREYEWNALPLGHKGALVISVIRRCVILGSSAP